MASISEFRRGMAIMFDGDRPVWMIGRRIYSREGLFDREETLLKRAMKKVNRTITIPAMMKIRTARYSVMGH